MACPRPLFEIAGSLLAVAFAGKGGLDALLLARLQVVGMTLDFLDDVFLLNLPLETAQGAFQALAFIDGDFGQTDSPPRHAS
jgi:hypothetical protein